MEDDEKDVVLAVRRLPPDLNEEQTRELLGMFGATRLTSTVVGRNKKNVVVYATFADKRSAGEALSRLHQLRVLGRRLVVEYAIMPSDSQDVEANGTDLGCSSVSSIAAKEPKKTSNVKDDIHRFSRDLNAIGRSFGLEYPISPKLYYTYPRPNATTLANIGGALLAVPKFYNQVLHLMNKMNLPAPFGPTIHFPGLTYVVPDELVVDEKGQSRLTRASDLEDDESELESDPETAVRPLNDKDVDKLSRPRRANAHKSKRARLMKRIVVSDSSQRTDKVDKQPEDVFDIPSSVMSRRIEFKLDMKLSEANEEVIPMAAVTRDEGELLADVTDIRTVTPPPPPPPPKKTVIGDDELKINRLSKEEMDALPVFKNYNPGAATSRLYLKNLAKQVEEDDLRSIYERYVGTETEIFDVRLMREGRMKGQAFITFANEAVAREALDNTNGFIFHGKPFVVQFAKGK